jgi:hypothetical protein
MSRNHRLGAATALALLGSVGLASGALAASSSSSGAGAAATTMGGAQTGVGDNGPGGNSAAMPANPAMQTDRKPMSAQSNGGCADAGERNSSSTACSTATKNMPPNPGPAASKAWNGGDTAGGGQQPSGEATAGPNSTGQGAGNNPPTAGAEQRGVVARTGPNGVPLGTKPEPGEPAPGQVNSNGQPAAVDTGDNQGLQAVRQQQGANAPAPGGLFGGKPQSSTTTEMSNQQPAAAGAANIPVAPKAAGQPNPLQAK